MTKYFEKYLLLWLVGGAIYGGIETIAKGCTHWTMVILGGTCFVLIGLLNEFLSWKTPLCIQMLFGSIIITTLEFITGAIINLGLGWGIWDYSDEWLNLLGQICPKYSFFWFCLSAVAILLDDYLRWQWFDEEQPKYKFL